MGRQAGHPSGLQRLFAIRRRDGRDCLRELRHSRRLRDARQTRNQRERANRARPIRGQLARDQTQSRGRARRHCLHHLFGSARRRLLSGRGLSRRAVPRVGHDPARERHGHAALSRRSIHARSTLEARCRADPDGQDRNVRADSGAADVVSRRGRAAEAVEGTGRAAGVARRAADHVSHRSRAGQGPHEPADGLRAAPPD